MAKADEIYELDGASPAAASTAPADAGRRVNEDGSVTLTLLYPVRIQYRNGTEEREEVLKELTLRRSNGGDLRHILRLKGDEEKILVTLFQRLTGLAGGRGDDAFNKLDAVDCGRFSAEVQVFLQQFQETGKTF